MIIPGDGVFRMCEARLRFCFETILTATGWASEQGGQQWMGMVGWDDLFRSSMALQAQVKVAQVLADCSWKRVQIFSRMSSHFSKSRRWVENPPVSSATWLAGKSPNWMEVFMGKSLINGYKWSIFHCHVWLPEGRPICPWGLWGFHGKASVPLPWQHGFAAAFHGRSLWIHRSPSWRSLGLS